MDTCNRSILYWKWDDSVLESDLAASIEDLCSRTDISNIFIGLHWIRRRFNDPRLLEALSFCSRELKKRGRRTIVEVCPRNEGEAFFERYPNDVAYLTTPTEVRLTPDGTGRIEMETKKIPHYWRTISHVKPGLLAAFIFDKTDGKIRKGSCQRCDHFITIEGQTDESLVARIDAGSENAGRTVDMFIGIPQPIPDLGSPGLMELYSEMLDDIAGFDIDGAASDEWGYDVGFRIIEAQEGSSKTTEIYFECISYSAYLDERYAKVCGRRLIDDLIYMYYQEEDGRSRSISCVNAYHKALREIMRQNDEEMYALAKAKLGEGAFYGVHPTWWGNNYLQNFEGFKNGFYWWEARRDIAQTDEIVIMPIRTALAHKWRCPYWYNMWYSMGTRDINTYYRETWNNVRYGGRTHYLGYECPNEPVVLELKPRGLLESIEEMDAVIREIDHVQTASPDCRVLILFGMQNALNWFYNDDPNPPWFSYHKVLTPVLRCADTVFRSFLCDLVPTTEIENGSLSLEDGKAVYGTQRYDAVVLLAPDSMSPACYAFLSGLDESRLIVAGEAEVYDDGSRVSEDYLAVLNRGVRLSEIYCPEEIIAALREWGIAANRFENGCVLQDGSLIFTSDGERAVHNRLSVHVRHKDLTIDFEGEDLLFLHHTDGKYIPFYRQGDLKLR